MDEMNHLLQEDGHTRLSLTARLFCVLWALWLLLGLHFFMHNPGGAGLYLPFNAWTWAFASVLIALGLWQSAQQRFWRSSVLQKQIGWALLLLCLPLLWTDPIYREQALLRFAALIAGGLLFACLYQFQWSEQARARLIQGLLVACAIELTLGLCQYYLFSQTNPMGYDSKANRPYGIFQQPNVMASFIATGMALALWFYGHTRTVALKLLQSYLLVGGSLLLVVLQSRVGQLAGLFVVLMMLPWLRNHKSLFWPLLLLAVGVGLGWTSLQTVEGVKRGTIIYQQAGLRSVYWLYGLSLWQQSFFSGWGYGAFESVFLQHYMADKASHPLMPQIEYNLGHPHNEILYWLIEGGVAALLAFALLAFALVRRLMANPWPQGLALLALITPILLHSQTEYPFYHSAAHWLFLMILIWYLDETTKPERPKVLYQPCQRGFWPILQAVALSQLLITVPFMLTTLHSGYWITRYERTVPQDIRLLNNISNSIAWRERLEFMINARQLQQALIAQDKQGLNDYVQWGQRFVSHTPRAAIYLNMILALKALNAPAQAQALMVQARMLYPSDPQFKALGLKAAGVACRGCNAR